MVRASTTGQEVCGPLGARQGARAECKQFVAWVRHGLDWIGLDWFMKGGGDPNTDSRSKNACHNQHHDISSHTQTL